MDKVQYYEAQLDENLSTFPVLKKLEVATTIPKTYMFLGVFVVVFLSLLFDIGGSFYTNLIGWSFPAYYSFQALEDKESKEYSQWIGYWSIFGFLTFVEASTDILNYLIPFYFLVKTIFLLWLLLPSYRGAEYTYRIALRPLHSRLSVFINDLADPDCPLPTMSDAAGSLRASATAAASKLEAEAKNAVAQVKAATTSGQNKATSENSRTESKPTSVASHSEKKADSEAGHSESNSKPELEHHDQPTSEATHSTPAHQSEKAPEYAAEKPSEEHNAKHTEGAAEDKKDA